MKEISLNIGCGTDYREGFINIDGSESLLKVDKVIDISKHSLTEFFQPSSISFILANDIIEHHYHWEAYNILKDFFTILKSGGRCEIRVPDCEFIVSNRRLDIETKLTLLFGGQDVPQGVDAEMDKSRKVYPQYFCHKYGWSMDLMKNDLKKIGFSGIKTERAGTNFIAIAKKSDK